MTTPAPLSSEPIRQSATLTSEPADGARPHDSDIQLDPRQLRRLWAVTLCVMAVMLLATAALLAWRWLAGSGTVAS